MKIFCVGRNYADHAKELNNPLPEQPVIFMKPDTALLKDGKPFYYPDFTNDLHHEVELVVRISRHGKHIQEKFAHKYYDQVSVGIDFTARDIQQKHKEKGLPWELAKSFDHSAVIGEFVSLQTVLSEKENVELKLLKNDNVVQLGNTSDFIFSIDYIIQYLSRFFTLRVGDLIYTGTPSGVGPVKIGDKLEGFLNDKCLLTTEIK